MEGRDNQEPTSASASNFELYDPGSDQFPFAVPPIWEQAYKTIRSMPCNTKRKSLLERLGFKSAKLELTPDVINERLGTQDSMERDRAYGKRLPPSSSCPAGDPTWLT